jgi:hypothetical protein
MYSIPRRTNSCLKAFSESRGRSKEKRPEHVSKKAHTFKMQTKMKCEYCDKEIATPNGLQTCSYECAEEVWERRFNSYPQRTDLTLAQLFEFFVESLLLLWEVGARAEYAEEVMNNNVNHMRIRAAANHPANQTSWGAVLKEAGRRRFGK